jgi:hypothetical protein
MIVVGTVCIALAQTLPALPAAQSGIENCWDYLLFRMDFCRVAPGTMNKSHRFPNYRFDKVKGSNPALIPGDVILVHPSWKDSGGKITLWDADHVAYVNPRGKIDHFLQTGPWPGKGTIYQPNNLPDHKTVKIGGQFLDETYQDFVRIHYPKGEGKVLILHPPKGTNVTDCPRNIISDISGGVTPPPQTTSYTKGKMLASARIDARNSKPTNMGVNLRSGTAYFVVGKGSVSLWNGQTDGCDSVYRHKTPLETNGGPLKIWGQLKLLNPNGHLSDFIKQQTGKDAIYNPGHVYEALIIGTGLPLEAIVYDGGGYEDNHGQLTVEVYEAIPR